MDIVLRASAMFAIVYVLIRLMGKRQLGQMTPFEFIALVVVGDLIQQGVTQTDSSLVGALLAIGTFMFWALLMNWLSYLSPRTERILEGEPRVVVRHGELLRQNLRRDRLTAAEIESEMRLAGIATLKEVEWAVLEPGGKISFIRRERDKNDSQQRDEKAPA